MVKKLQKSDAHPPAAPAGLLDGQLAQTVKDSAQQIWLAGLGAFAKAQGSGGKVFETLMKEGAHLQRLTQTAAGEKLGEKFGDVADKMSAMAGEVGLKANAQWDKLETIFEERTARALSRLGVPSARELTALSGRVDALAAALDRLGGKAEVSAKAPRAKVGKAGKALQDMASAAPPAKTARRRKAAVAPPAAAPAAAPAKTARRKRAV